MALSNTAVPKYYGAFRDAVIRGEIPVCREIEMEMNRIDELIADRGIYYDDRPVEGWIAYCEEELTLTDGANLVMLDTFKLWGEQIFGWYYFEEREVWEPNPNGPGGHFIVKTIKKRLINKQYLIVGRGAAKSLYDSCIQSYFENIDTSTTHQITTAPTMKQAEEVIQPIKTAITRAKGPLFRFLTEGSLQNTTGSKANRVKLASTKKGIENFFTGSLIEVRPMSIDTIKMELMKILKGEYPAINTSIWWYKLDSIDEISEPNKWLKANPNLGKTVTFEVYQRDVERAENAPAARNDILAKRFGLPMEGYTYYFTYEETLKYRDFSGMPCSMGGDLSRGDDFCDFTFMFPLSNGTFGIKTRAYISDLTFRKLPSAMRSKYEQFILEGSLIVMEGTVLDMMQVYEDLDNHIVERGYDVRCFGYDPYNAKEFVERWASENGPFGIEKVIQGAKTESVPLGELKKLSEERMLLFDEELMSFCMGNCITITDTNGNRKLYKKRGDQKIDAVAAMMDAYIAYKLNRDAFE